MDFMGGLSTLLSILSFAMFAAGAMKVFQMATTLSEMKDILTAIKLNAPVHPAVGAAVSRIAVPAGPPAPLPSTLSGEEMLRAALSELDEPVNPTSIELGNKS
jgi:hypothetical protein